MLRFLPDSPLEGLLRPWLMTDPVAGLYFEGAAPDWRFALLVPLLLALLLLRRRVRLTLQQGVTAAGMVVGFYLWTLVSGNGRYFTWGLVLVGPLLVMAVSLLPTSRSMRWCVLALVLVLQTVAVSMSKTDNQWALARLTEQTLPLQASPLRERPAVFLTVSRLSYSILVPLFHPRSRWANVSGQYEILPTRLEWDRLHALLDSPLRKYLVVPVRPEDHGPQDQPRADTQQVLDKALARHGLALMPGGCSTLESALSGPLTEESADKRSRRGFWVCELQATTATAVSVIAAEEPEVAAALDAVELRCPRFFPPGGSQQLSSEGARVRHYGGTDTRLWVEGGHVLFQYYRAHNPTVVGNVEAVRQGRFTIPCSKMPGRYLPVWQRG
jgi:hypothetical protein